MRTKSPERIVVDELIAAMEARPETFQADTSILKDRQSDIEVWIATSAFSAGICKPFEMNFGFWQSCRFHSALDRWKAWFIARQLRKDDKTQISPENSVST